MQLCYRLRLPPVSIHLGTVSKMSEICLEAEKFVEGIVDSHFLDRTFQSIDQSIAMASLFVALHLKIKAIASFTQSGSTALWISRLNLGANLRNDP